MLTRLSGHERPCHETKRYLNRVEKITDLVVILSQLNPYKSSRPNSLLIIGMVSVLPLQVCATYRLPFRAICTCHFPDIVLVMAGKDCKLWSFYICRFPILLLLRSHICPCARPDTVWVDVVQFNQFSASTLDREWPTSRGGRFTPIAPESEAGWLQNQSGRFGVEENVAPAENRTTILRSVRSRMLNVMFWERKTSFHAHVKKQVQIVIIRKLYWNKPSLTTGSLIISCN
jgi:hypothetical protein